MAGSQNKARKGSSGSTRRKSGRGSAKGPGDHAREAAAEWGKAIRHGTAALAPVTKSASAALKDRLSPGSGGERSLKDKANPTKIEKGGRVGDAADALLAKLGKPGKLASKASLGSRAVDRLTPDVGGDDDTKTGDDDGTKTGGDGGGDDTVQVPIQEAIEVAVPLRVAWALATRAEDYPEFMDRVSAGKREGKKARFDATVHGTDREVIVEVLEEVPEKRISWSASEGHEHTGVASFHEVAPGLTHIEVSIVLESEGLIQKLARFTHLTQHAVRSDLHRFKAYVELWQDEEEIDDAQDEADQPEKAAESKKTTKSKKADDSAKTAESEAAAESDQDEEPVAEADEDEEPPADADEQHEDEEPAPDDDLDEDDSAADKQVEQFEQAEVLEDEPEHAYSDVLENYESREAYADVRG